jgi:hypothetical protein
MCPQAARINSRGSEICARQSAGGQEAADAVPACASTTVGARAFEACVDQTVKPAKKADVITGKQSSHLRQCAQATRNSGS